MRVLLLLVSLCSCRLEWGAEKHARADESGRVMVYTSAYPPVVAALEAHFRQALPSVEVRFFQAGSEKLAARLDAELLADNPGADVLMASDPMYYQRLKKRGALQPYVSVRALRLDRRFVDEDGAFVACRLSVMGLAHRSDVQAPRRFSDLLTTHEKVTLPEPLGSGTMLATLVSLQRRMDVVEGLAKVGATSSGGGTAVVDRLRRREASVGIALYENVALAKSDDVRFVFPEDGAVIVPGGLALLRKSDAAARVYDAMLSEAVQKIFVANALHSPFDALPAGVIISDEDPAFVEATKAAWSKRFKEAR